MIDLLQVFLLSMTPIGELRLAIPIGLLVYHLNASLVFIVAIVGNLVPAFLLLLFLKKISEYLSKKFRFFEKLFSWWEYNTRGKHYGKVYKYGALGLVIFIAIPFPLTGAWTGALLATLMNLPLSKSIPAVTVGVIGAGVIVSTLVILGINIENCLGWRALIGCIIVIGLICFYFRKNKHKNYDSIV